MAPSRGPFPIRRSQILASLDKLASFRETMTFDEFAADWRNRSAAAAELMSVGEIMGRHGGHASAELADRFHNARNDIAHQYVHVTAEEIWELFEAVPRLREEVAAREDKSDSVQSVAKGK